MIEKIRVPVIIPKIFGLTNSETGENEYAIIMQHGGESLDPQKHRLAMFHESSGLMEQVIISDFFRQILFLRSLTSITIEKFMKSDFRTKKSQR